MEDSEDKKSKEEDKGILPTKNGGVTEFYSWTQPLIEELNVNIPIESWVKGEDLIVNYTSKTIYVAVKVKRAGQDPLTQVLVQGDLCAAIKVNCINNEFRLTVLCGK